MGAAMTGGGLGTRAVPKGFFISAAFPFTSRSLSSSGSAFCASSSVKYSLPFFLMASRSFLNCSRYSFALGSPAVLDSCSSNIPAHINRVSSLIALGRQERICLR
eukprot:TRINITY_DN8422_c0_g1_i1.p1 TRINITY_DN8422_c0_g1~~TRINITY_DN8422_c0_g1_i1.p1  ORF type:complete len:105 (+),score=12.34 TRINITY_DN8422_c0_g1_i1:260-574(+)